MKKLGLEFKEISSIEYEVLNDSTRVAKEDVTAKSLMTICEYLRDKKIVAPYEIKYPREKFIDNMMHRTNIAPDYIPCVKEFLESDDFSNIMKEAIYRVTSSIPNCEMVNRLLKGDLHMNKFPTSQLVEIRSLLLSYILVYHENNEYAVNSYIGLLNVFDEYMFFLDGLGPVNYIKGCYDKDKLAKAILIHSGLGQKRTRNYNKVNRSIFNEEHIISIYNKICKYAPWAKDDFILLVESLKDMSPIEFVNAYYDFVDNNFTCDNLDMLNDNVNFDDTSDYGEQDDIKREFLKRVEKPQKVKKIGTKED